MHPIVLKQKVDIVGPDLFGRKAKITFRPSRHRGWWWQVNRKTPAVQINPSIIGLKARRSKLVCDNHKLEVFEHIGALRWFNLCDLTIESTPWPPYHGRSLEFWEAIKYSCEVDTSREVPWYTLEKTVRWTYPKIRGGQTAYTEIRPNNEKRLRVKVVGKYSKLPACEMTHTFPCASVSEEISSVYSQGLPLMLYHLLKIPSLCGWPHHDKFIWRQNYKEEPWDYKKKEIQEKLVQHRTNDILGILSLLCKDGLLSADVTSVCSGHKADINVIMRADSLLRRL